MSDAVCSQVATRLSDLAELLCGQVSGNLYDREISMLVTGVSDDSSADVCLIALGVSVGVTSGKSSEYCTPVIKLLAAVEIWEFSAW